MPIHSQTDKLFQSIKGIVNGFLLCFKLVQHLLSETCRKLEEKTGAWIFVLLHYDHPFHLPHRAINVFHQQMSLMYSDVFCGWWWGTHQLMWCDVQEVQYVRITITNITIIIQSDVLLLLLSQCWDVSPGFGLVSVVIYWGGEQKMLNRKLCPVQNEEIVTAGNKHL